MKIIVGLGNPGEKFDGIRHNVGFEILDYLQKEWGCSSFAKHKKFNAEISEGRSDPPADPEKSKFLLLKPQTFMNLSGESVAAVLDFYKLSPGDVVIIHDDLDIALGKYRLATDSSSAGHNGIQNIIDRLGTQKFRRIRIGIGEEVPGEAIRCRLNAHNFVLQKFSQEDMEKIRSIKKEIAEELKKFL